MNLHKWNMDFYQSLMIIAHSYPLADFQNSGIMEIHDTNDDSWCNLWNDTRITKILHLIMDPTIHWLQNFKCMDMNWCFWKWWAFFFAYAQAWGYAGWFTSSSNYQEFLIDRMRHQTWILYMDFRNMPSTYTGHWQVSWFYINFTNCVWTFI